MRDIKLSSLRICVEVMRRRSITATAQALNMTQSAVSKNVLLVEKQLGARLFQRSKDGVVAKDSALDFLLRVAGGIGSIDAALADFSGKDGQGTLRIVAPPIIIQHLLIPHLDDLHARHPGIELVFRVRTALSRSGADKDAEIFFSSEQNPPPQAQWLGGDRFSIVAHPALAPRELPMSEIANYPLLRHSRVERAWTDLAQRIGWRLPSARFHDYE
jgi:DNA-binding transcriptional LysR family regulator